MDAQSGKKRKRQDKKAKPLSRKAKLAAAYHSSSEEEGDVLTGANLIVGTRKSRVAEGRDDRSDDEPAPSDADDGILLPNLSTTTTPLGLPAATPSPPPAAKPTTSPPSLGAAAAKSMAPSSSPSASENDSDSDESDENDDDDSANTSASSSPSDQDDIPDTSTPHPRKRNDPTRLATSITAILTSKLTAPKRADPILSRSAAASSTTAALADSKLAAKARRKLREERRVAMERGRVRDVLGTEQGKEGEGGGSGGVAEHERRLRKVAQRGVVKLFNAVRAAQVKGEEAAREAGRVGEGGTGVVGADRRKERVVEMSKKGFLELLVDGGRAE